MDQCVCIEAMDYAQSNGFRDKAIIIQISKLEKVRNQMRQCKIWFVTNKVQILTYVDQGFQSFESHMSFVQRKMFHSLFFVRYTNHVV